MALTNAQYDAIMRQYNDAQLRHRRLQEEHRSEVYAALPRMAELDAEAASLSMQRARALLDSDLSCEVQDNASEKAYLKAMEEIREERDALLQTHGWPSDYLEIGADCPYCRDTGYADGQKCSCFRQKEIDLLYAQSNLSHVLSEDTFSRFSLSWYPDKADQNGCIPRQDARRALDAARKFTDGFGSGETANLCFYGSVGVGKTFLTHCIAGELLKKGYSVLYQTSYELFENLGTYTFSSEHELKEAHDAVFSCDLLIIDDLGTELTNSFVASQLFLIMNDRALQHRSTVLSTNISPEAFADTFSERVSSRLLGSYTLIRLSGPDIRLLKRLQHHETDTVDPDALSADRQ